MPSLPQRLNPIAWFRQVQPLRGLILLLIYSGTLTVSLWIAYQLRFDFVPETQYQLLFWDNLFWIIPLKLILLFAFGQFGGLLSYFRLPDLYRIFGAMVTASLFLIYIWYVTDGKDCPPRSVILGDFIISIIGLAGFRLGIRIVRERFFEPVEHPHRAARRAAIVGAGDTGAAIASDLLARRGLGIRPIVFLDDDPAKLKHHVHGIPVVDTPANLATVARRFDLEEVIIAMPRAPAKRVAEVVRVARALDLNAEIVPGLSDLTSGRVRATRMRPVEIEDLLGRESVELDSEAIGTMIRGKTVLVTGAGGSIGRELCLQIARRDPSRLLLVDQSEFALFEIDNTLTEEATGVEAMPMIADILDRKRMDGILRTYRPRLIFHAAAHKHVHMMERQPAEAVKNNAFGTALLADLAIEHGVERFVFVSTDKAINPTSAMGVSKRLAEIYLQARQPTNGATTRFMAVRFGNVLGSSGSVVPIFRRQIAHGGPVTVTHPEVTRYFMTIPEAVGLVLQCATQGRGGEIYVLDMGNPVKILDLARQMIELSGYRPEIDIAIEVIGMRPGEKLYEELRHTAETHEATEHSRIMRFVNQPYALEEVRPFFDELRANIDRWNRNDLRRRIQEFVPEYTPWIE